MAKIGAAHGIKGWVRLHSFAEPAEGLKRYRQFHSAPDSLPHSSDNTPDSPAATARLVVREYGHSGGHLIAAFVGCDDRHRAEDLRGTRLHICESDLPPAGRDEYYWHELVGMSVHTKAGEGLGQVRQLLQTGAQDVLVVGDAAAEREHLIPWAHSHLAIEVDRAGRNISLDWDPEF